MNGSTIDFKDPKWALTWLDTALEMEKQKYANCPVKQDMVPGYVDAQGWGYVVIGYFLSEFPSLRSLSLHGPPSLGLAVQHE